MRLYVTHNDQGDGCISGEIVKAYTDDSAGVPNLCIVFKDYSVEHICFSEFGIDNRWKQCGKALKWIYQQLALNDSGIVKLSDDMHFIGNIHGIVKAVDEYGDPLSGIAQQDDMCELD